MFKRVAEDSSSILHFSVEFIPHMVDCLLVASRQHQQPTKHMKSYKLENDSTTGYLEENKPFPIPEPPMWLGMSLAALLGGIFVSLIIVFYHILHP